jgi:hypothetical protein
MFSLSMEVTSTTPASDSPHRVFLENVVRFIMNRADRISGAVEQYTRQRAEVYRPRKEIDIVPLAFHPPELSGAGGADLGSRTMNFYLSR